MVPGRGESTKKMYDKSETASKPSRFELGKSEKNRRNLKLIQTCDFLFLCILYIILYNIDWRDVKFSLHYIQFIFSGHVSSPHNTEKFALALLLPTGFFVPSFC